MRAARIFGPQDIRVVDVPKPEVGPGDVLCKVLRCGICGTDYSIYTGEFSPIAKGQVVFPMTPGHEWSGIVAEAGRDVEGFKPGDRVVGDTGVSCGVCYDCLMGRYCYCKKARAVGTLLTWDGAYAEYILMPARHVFHLPDSVSLDNGAMVEPAATGLYSVVKAGVKIGDTVLVQGSGPIGIAAAKLAKLCGAVKVIITGRKNFKLDAALALGVDAAVNLTEVSIDDAIKTHTGEWGIDRVIEASGSTELLVDSLRIINPGGTVSLVGTYNKLVPDFEVDVMAFKDIPVVPVAGSLGMYGPVLRLMAVGMLDLSSLVTVRYALEDVPQAMLDMEGKSDVRIKMMIHTEE